MNELISQGHRICLRRPPPHERVIEFYRLMGSEDFAYLTNIFRSDSFLSDRGFLGIIITTFLNSINFEVIPHLIINPFDLGILRSLFKNYIIKKFSSDNVESIVECAKEKLYENYYHYLMGVAPFSISRNNLNMVGSLQNLDGSMIERFYTLVFDGCKFIYIL